MCLGQISQWLNKILTILHFIIQKYSTQSVPRNLFSDVVHNIHDSSPRPLNMREIKEEAKDIIYMDEINHECTLACPPGPPQTCTLYISKSLMGLEDMSNRKKDPKILY